MPTSLKDLSLDIVRPAHWGGEYCGVHIVYFLCVFVYLRFVLVCVVFGPRMHTFRRTLVVRA